MLKINREVLKVAIKQHKKAQEQHQQSLALTRTPIIFSDNEGARSTIGDIFIVSGSLGWRWKKLVSSQGLKK